jgi:Zn-dependent M28 family amino/carboxypeptidase
MSKRKWTKSLVFCGFSGEEQGLHGARALARRAKAEGWQIDAMLNNDTVGSSRNKSGQKDEKRVRVFSAEFVPQAADGAAGPAARPPHNSRELARFIEWATRDMVRGFGIKLVFRQDRFGRGGDHTPFMEEGFPAVRFIEVHEEYSQQHTPDDLPQYMDWRYLANVTRMNLITMASIAEAGPAPTAVRVNMSQGHDTNLTWTATPGTRYTVYWRETTSPTWQGSRDVGAVDKATIEKANKDDHVFAVGSTGGVPVVAR